MEIMRRGGVILTTYGTCAADPGVLGAVSTAAAGEDPSTTPAVWIPASAPEPWQDGTPARRSEVTWDLVVLDEGHKIKNVATQVRGCRCMLSVGLYVSDTHCAGAQGCAGSPVAIPPASLRHAHSE